MDLDVFWDLLDEWFAGTAESRPLAFVDDAVANARSRKVSGETRLHLWREQGGEAFTRGRDARHALLQQDEVEAEAALGDRPQLDPFLELRGAVAIERASASRNTRKQSRCVPCGSSRSPAA